MGLRLRLQPVAVLASCCPFRRAFSTTRFRQAIHRQLPAARSETPLRSFRRRTLHRSSRRSDKIASFDSVPSRTIGISANRHPIPVLLPHSGGPGRSASVAYPRGRGVAEPAADPAVLASGEPRRNRHQGYSTARPRFELAAGAGIAFPTVSANAHQESTRRANRLCHRSLGSIEPHVFTFH